SKQIGDNTLSNFLILGELSLDGSIQSIKGALPIATQARSQGFKKIMIPKSNAREAAIVNDLEVYGVENIKDVIDFFNNKNNLEQTKVDTREEFLNKVNNYESDFADVRG